MVRDQNETENAYKKLNEENIYKPILLRFPPPQFVSSVWIRQLSASKPWHPNHLENKRVSACCHFGAEFAASSCLLTDIIILLEGVCGAGFELCSPFWILSLFSAVAPVCFPLVRFSSSRHGPVMLLHGTLAHTFPIFDFSVDSQESVCCH